MGGDAKIFSERETAEMLRKRCPTSIKFLREMAGVDFYPRYKERFAEAADEIERLGAELTLLHAVNEAARDFIYARLHHPNRVKKTVQLLVVALDKYAKWDASKRS